MPPWDDDRGIHNAARSYGATMIKTFRDRRTETLFHGGHVPLWHPELTHRAMRKLHVIDAATDLRDLRAMPGNRLEKLAGDRSGSWSVRVNDRWRICFRWSNGHAEDVELVDYH
ncbi:MAG: type II toxin-antitoxin system RelE/ParE family toxin [Phycisphaerales bacterium]